MQEAFVKNVKVSDLNWTDRTNESRNFFLLNF